MSVIADSDGAREPVRKVDALVAEIGSTTTVVSAFVGLGPGEDRPAGVPAAARLAAALDEGAAGTSRELPRARMIGQGQALTTATSGDVSVGLDAALSDLCLRLGARQVAWDRMMASSSAAGGLRMTVHGLVYDMTARAAREAALGAGAVVKLVTAGRLGTSDLARIVEAGPRIMLLAGGVDYGDTEVILHNARALSTLGLKVPVIYAGNVACREEACGILSGAGVPVVAVDNVYPRIDVLDVEPTRRAIQRVFEQHITSAPGMSTIRTIVDGEVMPTPGAVMTAAVLLRRRVGDLMVVDVGGATTDVHSVTDGSDEIQRMLLAPEPVAKRTVEGDLGVFINARHLIEEVGSDVLTRELGMAPEEVLQEERGIPPLPARPRAAALVECLTRHAVRLAVDRHVGRLRHIYGPLGRITVAEGKDLTRVKWLVGTGGALVRLSESAARLALGAVKSRGPGTGTAPTASGALSSETRLLPPADARVVLDSRYIMASMGVLAARYPAAAVRLLAESLGIKVQEVGNNT